MNNFEEFKNARVLVAGGMGFIGSNLAQRLVGLGAKVTIIDNLMPNYGGNLFNIREVKDKVRISISDVKDETVMSDVIKNQDYLFNMVGQTSHIDSMRDPYTDLEANCRAQLSILEACRLYNPGIKVIFASTRQIYGKPDYLPVDENHPIRPIDINGVNKMAGEWHHILYDNIYEISTCIFRLTNTYGPRMRIKDARQTFVGAWINSMVQGKNFEVWDGRQLRDFIYVDDVVEAMLLAAVDRRAYGQIFNLGGDVVIGLKELADLLVEINGGGNYIICPFPADKKKIDIGDYYSDFSKIRDLLGWKPTVSLREGFSHTLAYYKEHLKQYL